LLLNPSSVGSSRGMESVASELASYKALVLIRLNQPEYISLLSQVDCREQCSAS